MCGRDCLRNNVFERESLRKWKKVEESGPLENKF